VARIVRRRELAPDGEAFADEEALGDFPVGELVLLDVVPVQEGLGAGAQRRPDFGRPTHIDRADGLMVVKSRGAAVIVGEA
jgi:hypothetical protein